MRKEVEELWTLVEPHVAGAGLDLVDLEWNREAEGWVLRVFIDQPWSGQAQDAQPVGAAPEPREAISFSECERVSRDLSAALDVADVITHAYRLEVSSPGIDRPLRRPRDFQRFAGRQAKIRMVEGVEGRRNFSGTICGAQNDVVEVECDGRRYQLPVGAIARARLVPDWDAEFRRGGAPSEGANHSDPQPGGPQPRGAPHPKGSPYRSAS